MEIKDTTSFLKYYTKIKARTDRIIGYVPPEHMEWTYKEGKFTIGDLIRHIVTIERFMYAENAQLKPSRYAGCGPEYAEGYEATLAFYKKMRAESTAIFEALTYEDLNRKCTTPAGIPITTWKWLRAMVEHEIHHRAQIYTYLGILGVKTPPLYGLTAEEVADRRAT